MNPRTSRRTRPWAAAAAAAAAVALVAPLTPAAADSAGGARPDYRLTFVDGPPSPEDIVRVPGTRRLIVSGLAADPLAEGSVGHLYAVNTRNGRLRELWPERNTRTNWDRSTYPTCPGPPDRSLASPHGINIEKDRRGRSTLYVVNHGGREAVEVFRVRTSPLRLTWVGCTVMPEGTFPNGVAPLPQNKGLVVSNFFDPTAGNPFDKLFTGEVTGDVRKWTPRRGWSVVPDSDVSGANGVEVTPDGRTVVVAAWGDRRVYRIPMQGRRPGTGWFGKASVTVPMKPDNLRWTPKGRLLLTGQDITRSQFDACQANDLANCPTGMEVLELDPRTMRVRTVFASQTTRFRVPTVATPVGRDIWVGTVKGDRFARLVRR